VITRRIFVGALAGVCARREHLVLEAIAAERMPHRLVVSGVEMSPFFELRDYGSAAPRLVAILNRHGIKPVLEENGRFLFPFDSLAARERAWRRVSADPEWVRLHAHVSELAVYVASS
jgi:hypothetical protein